MPFEQMPQPKKPEPGVVRPSPSYNAVLEALEKAKITPKVEAAPKTQESEDFPLTGAEKKVVEKIEKKAA